MIAIIDQCGLPDILMHFRIKILRITKVCGPFEANKTAGYMRLTVAGAE